LVAANAGAVPPVVIAILTATRLAFLAIAGLVLWRRGQDPAGRALATFLAAFGAALSVDFNVLADPVARLLLFLLAESLFMLGGVAILAFACAFPTPLPGSLRARIARAVPAIAALGLTLTCSRMVSAFVFGIGGRTLLIVYVCWYTAVLLLALGAFIGSYRTAGGPERVRMRWILATFGVGFSGLIVLLVGIAFNVSASALQYFGLTVLLIPIGLGYTILRHRVLDIGFVINRAVVYTGVSFVVVGAFITFEWMLGHLVERGSNTSVALQLGGALALGLSVRFIHNRVDRYVDDVFFRDRHAAEAAVRRFAREAPLITSSDDLVRKTIEVAQSKMHLSGCAFYARLGDAFVPLQSTISSAAAVSENDYAILEMRAWHAAVDPHARGSELAGDLAFPMMVRGELSGFLLCGEKETHEVFAPDERDAMGVLARDVGIALDSLRVRTIDRELTFLAGDGNLPKELRARLVALLERNPIARESSDTA
jgi:hypothetical protein